LYRRIGLNEGSVKGGSDSSNLRTCSSVYAGLKASAKKRKAYKGKTPYGKKTPCEKESHTEKKAVGENAPRQSAHLMMGSRRLSWSSNT
jgi:hypothetical protein